ncbi:MAG TPA: hypothetical protein VK176_14195 [Phycisphaerales bacterium]|nr:hypothetical protein [Phycisphaerales bacterium]
METPTKAVWESDPVVIRIEGMSCGHCVAAVRDALTGAGGLEVLEVRVAEARVRERTQGAVARGVAAIQDAGFGASVMS